MVEKRCPISNEVCQKDCPGPWMATHYSSEVSITREPDCEPEFSESPNHVEIVCGNPLNLDVWNGAKFVHAKKPAFERLFDEEEDNTWGILTFGEQDNPTEVIVFTRLIGNIPDNQ